MPNLTIYQKNYLRGSSTISRRSTTTSLSHMSTQHNLLYCMLKHDLSNERVTVGVLLLSFVLCLANKQIPKAIAMRFWISKIASVMGSHSRTFPYSFHNIIAFNHFFRLQPLSSGVDLVLVAPGPAVEFWRWSRRHFSLAPGSSRWVLALISS